jgi:SAM-dependent methyltransferase
MRILDLGCGRAKTPGAIGADLNRRSHADVILDLDQLPLPFHDNSFDSLVANSVVEHVEDIVRFMEEVHRVCRPGARVHLVTPHFSSADAYADPTHRHYLSLRSFDYFTGAMPEFAFYSTARFQLTRAELFFWRLPRLGGISPQHWLGARLLADRFPHLYERFFAFVLPAQGMVFELVVVKAG